MVLNSAEDEFDGGVVHPPDVAGAERRQGLTGAAVLRLPALKPSGLGSATTGGTAVATVRESSAMRSTTSVTHLRRPASSPRIFQSPVEVPLYIWATKSSTVVPMRAATFTKMRSHQTFDHLSCSLSWVTLPLRPTEAWWWRTIVFG